MITISIKATIHQAAAIMADEPQIGVGETTMGPAGGPRRKLQRPSWALLSHSFDNRRSGISINFAGPSGVDAIRAMMMMMMMMGPEGE